ELAALSTEDFKRILVEPDASLTEQYTALLATEGLTLEFSNDGLDRIAEIAWQVNEGTENIGARRLHTVMERLLEEISFQASEAADGHLRVDADYVDGHLAELARDQDLSRYIL
ncbi:MAG: HslU--HslV peptidase ATPase subunit, partial [Gammaproteobacteria bacterium]|nr:HslU--HslV peptidase ATPase subunit [Gammaproteobacteria bacterium]